MITEEQFKREYLCEFTPNPNERALYEIAKRYHEVTEAYDRTVCTGPIVKGLILPESHYQVVAINRHARQVFNDLFHGAESLGITRAEMQEAVGKYHA